MEVRLTIEYKDKIYHSDYKEVTEDEKADLEQFIELISQGKSTYLSIEGNGNKFYFPEDVLKQSIITIETKK